MKHLVLYCLLGSLSLGCADHRIEEDNLNAVKYERVITTLLADISQWGIQKVNGFAKQGSRVVVETGVEYGGIKTIDLNHPGAMDPMGRGESSNDRFRSLSSFNSFDGETVTALDFRKGELVVNAVSFLARSGNSETVIKLPSGEQHLIAARVGDRVIATGLYDEGRYLLYSLPDQSARYFLSYPDHPGYPGLREKTKAMLYASNVLRVRPDGGAFVCADMYSGVIDFCRVTADSIERVRLVRLHYPEVEVSETPSPRVVYCQGNRFGFLDVAVTEDKVYALYSGKTYKMDRGRAFESNCLLVYDWAGNLIRTLYFGDALTGISYDRKEGALYGITQGLEIGLIKLNL